MKECKRVECMGSNGCIDKCWKPQRTWVGLTGGEIDECFAITPDQYLPWQIYQRIEKRLKEKNT